MASERVKWLEHKGKKILFIDCSGLSGEKYVSMLDEVEVEYKKLAKNSALVLIDAHFPQGVRIFPEVPVVPMSRWKRFLNKREVYLRSSDGQYHHVTGIDLPHSAPMGIQPAGKAVPATKRPLHRRTHR